MFDDIVANTNPILAYLPDAEEIQEIQATNMYISYPTSFFNIKQFL
jgi:hypothetical protein